MAGPKTGAVFLALFLALVPTALANELELPENTATSRYPPYAPFGLSDHEALRAWAEKMLEQGRARAGTDSGGDACISAADLLAGVLLDRRQALPAFRAALSAYPDGHPYAGVALLHIAFLEHQAGNLDAAQATLRRLDRWQVRGVRNPTRRQRSQREKAAEIHIEFGLTVRRLVREGMGRFEEAARLAEEKAQSTANAEDWKIAARLYARAGRTEDALRSMDRALPLARNERDEAYMRVWRVYARFGLITQRGAMAQPETWPGDAWFREALATVDQLGANPLAAGYAVQLGGHCYVTRRFKEAIQAYERALRHPDVVQGRDNMGPEAFLLAVSAANKAGLYDESRRLLARVRMIFGNTELIDEVDIGIRTAEERADLEARRAAEAEAARKIAAAPTTIDPRLVDPQIVPAGRGAPGEPPPPTAPEEPMVLPIPLVLLALAAVVGLLILVQSRRH